MQFRRKLKPKTIALLVVVALVVIILVQNMDSVVFHILIWHMQVPKLVLILISVLFGWVAGWFTHLAYSKGKYTETGSASAETQSTESPTLEPKGQD